MIRLPPHLYKQYREFCVNSSIKDCDLMDYMMWLRYFLDFCEKYQLAGNEEQRTRLFMDKLQQKKQSEEKRSQAQYAV